MPRQVGLWSLSGVGLLAIALAAWLTTQPTAGGAQVIQDEAAEQIRAAALATTTHYMDAFNQADLAAWAATLHFPHVRIAQGQVRIWQSAEEYARDGFDFAALRATGWHHSRWDERRVLQHSPQQVNLLVRFTRYRADDTPLSSYEAVYVLTHRDGHWGVQARASTAP